MQFDQATARTTFTSNGKGIPANAVPAIIAGYNDTEMVTETLVITTNTGRIEIPVQMTQAQGDEIGNALYGASGEIRITLADEDGWEIGVNGAFYDSER